MVEVGLDPATMDRYPHEFSGGQRQRIGIARTIALKPKLIICDESVSALDVSIQAQIINLMMDLREKLKIAFLFISHDMSIVEYFCDRVAVMYLGKIVEIASIEEIYKRPGHPYTEALINAVPGMESGQKKQKLKYQLKLERSARLREEEQFQEKFNFFTNVSHEIRTPLTLISGSLEHIMEQFKNNEEGRKIKGKVAFLGGPLTFASELRKRFIETLDLDNVFIPENGEVFVAFGASLSAKESNITLDDLLKKISYFVIVIFQI